MNQKDKMNKEKYNMFGTISGKNKPLKYISTHLGDPNKNGEAMEVEDNIQNKNVKT